MGRQLAPTVLSCVALSVGLSCHKHDDPPGTKQPFGHSFLGMYGWLSQQKEQKEQKKLVDYT